MRTPSLLELHAVGYTVNRKGMQPNRLSNGNAVPGVCRSTPNFALYYRRLVIQIYMCFTSISLVGINLALMAGLLQILIEMPSLAMGWPAADDG